MLAERMPPLRQYIRGFDPQLFQGGRMLASFGPVKLRPR